MSVTTILNYAGDQLFSAVKLRKTKRLDFQTTKFVSLGDSEPDCVPVNATAFLRSFKPTPSLCLFYKTHSVLISNAEKAKK
jgi:hypothetical protein